MQHHFFAAALEERWSASLANQGRGHPLFDRTQWATAMADPERQPGADPATGYWDWLASHIIALAEPVETPSELLQEDDLLLLKFSEFLSAGFETGYTLLARADVPDERFPSMGGVTAVTPRFTEYQEAGRLTDDVLRILPAPSHSDHVVYSLVALPAPAVLCEIRGEIHGADRRQALAQLLAIAEVAPALDAPARALVSVDGDNQLSVGLLFDAGALSSADEVKRLAAKVFESVPPSIRGDTRQPGVGGADGSTSSLNAGGSDDGDYRSVLETLRTTADMRPPLKRPLRGAPADASGTIDVLTLRTLRELATRTDSDLLDDGDWAHLLGAITEIDSRETPPEIAWGFMRALAASTAYLANPASGGQQRDYMSAWRELVVDIAQACNAVGEALVEATPGTTFVLDTRHGADDQFRWSGVLRGDGIDLLWVDVTLNDAECHGDEAGFGISVEAHLRDGVLAATWVPHAYTAGMWTLDPEDVRGRLTQELDTRAFARQALTWDLHRKSSGTDSSTPPKETWQKLPTEKDGPLLWQRSDGWAIEAKPRPDSSMDYELTAAPGFRESAGGAWPLILSSLANAKEAADKPRPVLLEMMREAYEDYQALWAPGALQDTEAAQRFARIHADAIAEHAQFPKRFLQPWLSDVQGALHAYREMVGDHPLTFRSPYESHAHLNGSQVRIHALLLLPTDSSDWDEEALPAVRIAAEDGSLHDAFLEELFPCGHDPASERAFYALQGLICVGFRAARALDFAGPLDLAESGSTEHLKAFRDRLPEFTHFARACLDVAWAPDEFRPQHSTAPAAPL